MRVTDLVADPAAGDAELSSETKVANNLEKFLENLGLLGRQINAVPYLDGRWR